MAMESSHNRGLTPELIKIAEQELGETDETRTQGIKELKRRIKDEPDFNPCTDNAFLVRFLRARKYNIDKAYKTLKDYYTFKAQNSGVITDLRPSQFVSRVSLIKSAFLDHRDHNQGPVGYSRLGRIDTAKHSPEDIYSYTLLLVELILESEITQIVGYSLIIDFAGLTLRKARHYASPTFLYKMVNTIQESYPARIRAFHMVNEPVYFDILFSLVRPFLSNKMRNRFHFHGRNLDTLHKHIRPDILPQELGGDQGPSEDYQMRFFKFLCAHEDYFIRMQKFGYTGKTLQKLSKENKKSVPN